jgi:hypothetical protein
MKRIGKHWRIIPTILSTHIHHLPIGGVDVVLAEAGLRLDDLPLLPDAPVVGVLADPHADRLVVGVRCVDLAFVVGVEHLARF